MQGSNERLNDKSSLEDIKVLREGDFLVWCEIFYEVCVDVYEF